MLTIEKYAGIDLGSNAIRLLIAYAIEQENGEVFFRKASLVRVPIRLGADVFLNGRISEKNISRMIDSLHAFKLLMKTHQVVAYRACATSAMREAENGAETALLLQKKTSVAIDIIDGKDEAAIIASTDLKNLIVKDQVFLYVDVGGGSTELTLFANGTVIASRSLELGTVRLLNNQTSDRLWDDMKSWIISQTRDFESLELIGSGGNINTIFKKSGRKAGKPLSYSFLNSYYKQLNALDYESRIVEMELKPDRADVVIPAARIFLSAMKWAKAKKIHVPKIGLSDGIVRNLYNNNKERAGTS